MANQKSQGRLFAEPKPRAVLLGIDPGERDGFCIITPGGNIERSGESAKRDAYTRLTVVRMAVTLALDLDVDLLVGREKWTAGGERGTPAMFAGLGAQWGRWQEQLDLNARYLPDSRIVGVYPQQWRSVCGVGGGEVETKMSNYARERWPKYHVTTDGGMSAYDEDEEGVRRDVAPWQENELMALGVAVWLERTQLDLAQRKPRWHEAAREGRDR